MEIKALKDLLPYCLENCTKKTLAVIKAEDDHTLTAVARARKEGAIEAVLIGDAAVIKNLLAQIGEKEEDYRIIDEVDEREAILKAIELVHAGEVDFLMKGLLETKNLMSAIVAKTSGMRTGRLMSKFDFVEIAQYHKLIALTDSALNTKPDAEAKKQIIQNALDVMYSVGIQKPKIAVLAASETLNPKLQESADAWKLKQMWENGEFTDCYLEGPISIDLALEKESVEIKNYQSPVGGDADMLVCPDLVSGNMMGKMMTICGGRAAGIIVGAKVPIVLMSRAAEIDDKFQSIILGAIASQKGA